MNEQDQQPVRSRDAHSSEARTISVDSGAAHQQPAAAMPIGAGVTIGRYTIERVIGEGGMGVVYAARQHAPDRLVALKLVRPGFATARSLQRLTEEADLLGRLEHPGIARIYDAGLLEHAGAATPYFAMELVSGTSLTTHAAEQQLSTRSRLELLAAVCDAIQHAHQKGVIHRDLKPGNILVDESGQPRVLDFGIARAIDTDIQQTMQTRTSELLGTVPYMSPEQTTGDASRVDTRSDVYALGVIGHELLAGEMPYTLENTTIHDALRIIQQSPPRRLGSINRALRGDVETIIGKALEKEPERRYQSAGEFAADIRRYLRAEPIEARPASPVYQLSRFAKRHRALVGAAAAVFLTVVAGGATAGVLAVREARARADLADALTIAQHKTDIANAVNEFLRVDILGQANPERQQNPDLTVREAVDLAAASVGERFAGQPEVEAAVRFAIGMVYNTLARYDRALEQFTIAQQRFAESIGPDAQETVHAEGMVAVSLDGLGRYEEAEQAFEHVLQRYEQIFGPDHLETLHMMHNYAVLLDDLGRSAEALEILKKQFARLRAAYGDRHPDTQSSMSAVAQVHLALQQFEEAAPLLHALLDIRRETLGDDHPRTMIIRNNLAIMYMNGMEDYAQAQPLLEQVVQDRVRILGEGHVSTLTSMDNLAVLYMKMERYDDAIRLFEREINAARTSLGDDHPDTCWAYYNFGRCYQQMGELALAAQWHTRALEGRQASLPPEHPHIERSMRKVVQVLTQMGDYEALEPVALARHAWLVEHAGADHEATIAARQAIAEMYTAWGRPEEAARWNEPRADRLP